MSIIKKILGGAALLGIGVAAGIYTLSNYENVRRYLPIKHQEEQIATIGEYIDVETPRETIQEETHLLPEKKVSPAAYEKIYPDLIDKISELEKRRLSYRGLTPTGLRRAYVTDLTGDSSYEIIFLINNDMRNFDYGESTVLDIFSYDLSDNLFHHEGTIKDIQLRDIDNDGLREIVGEEPISPSESFLRVVKRIPTQKDSRGYIFDAKQIKFRNDIEIKDLDNDYIEEIIADGEVYRWNGSYFSNEDVGSRDSFRTARSETKPNLEERINTYPQQAYQDQYFQGLTEKHIRLNIILEDEIKTSPDSSDDRISNARVHYTITPGLKQDIFLRDNPAINRGNGVYRINEDIQLSSNDYARLCLTMEASNFLPIYKCFDSDSMERTQIGDQFLDESSRATFTTIKAKGQNVIGYPGFQGNLEDITIRIDWPRISDLPRGTFP